MGTDWIMKFAVDDTVDESSECMHAALTNMAGNSARIVQTATETIFIAEAQDSSSVYEV